jgi:hypothetical protein
MCFRPKRRASMDHAPGPIIAMVAPRMARTIGIQGSLPLAKAIHSSTAPIKLPTTGVHNPTRRSIPAQAAIICGIIDGEKDLPASSMIAKRRSRMAVRMRWRRRPTPGQPLANVENSRCKTLPHRHRRRIAMKSKRLKVGGGHPTFGGDQFRDHSSMMPRFRPIVTAWARSLAPNLDSMFVTWLFTVASPIES